MNTIQEISIDTLSYKEIHLNMPQSDLVDYRVFSRLLDDDKVVASYKMYWLLGILDEVALGNTEIEFKKIISRMIVYSWYPILQYKLNYGIFDNLKKPVNYIAIKYNLPNNYDENKLLDFIYSNDDKELNKMMKELTYNVPYRLLSPFFTDKLKGQKDSIKNKMITELSGGQITRLCLAKLLLEEPKLLVLDEPTNHLDSQAISFLENYLKGYKNALIVVSHDRYFIDVVSNKIIEIENGKSHSYNCRYEEYSIQKRTQRAIDLKHYINQQKEIKKIQESIDTLKSFNREKSIKRAESKEKQLAKIERIDRPENLPSAITVQFTPAIESGYDVLKVTDLSMRYDQIVFEHCNLYLKLL